MLIIDICKHLQEETLKKLFVDAENLTLHPNSEHSVRTIPGELPGPLRFSAVILLR